MGQPLWLSFCCPLNSAEVQKARARALPAAALSAMRRIPAPKAQGGRAYREFPQSFVSPSTANAQVFAYKSF